MSNRGFTLIEMSIVLVVIGMIIGGIFLGQSLIRQSQINSTISDEQKYVQAVQNFQQKFGQLPGDFSTANTYWSTASNGNGNGQIGTGSEAFQFWHHLVDAQMIQGYYSGSAGSAGANDHVIGTNCPTTRVDGAGFGVNYTGIKSGDADYFDSIYGHVFILGGYSSNALPYGKILTAQEAFNIDTKYDDGLPAYGNILTWKSTGSINTTCATSGTASSAAYSTTTGYRCSIIFIAGF
jgi:prepilin-type N-terminal cleavage/methylation domain-containing protein